MSDGNFESILLKIVLFAIPGILAITLHEAAHGWAADKLGDSTARRLGRITANPLKHIDPIGTLLLPALMIALTPFVFGWAKPVPVNMNQLHSPKKDMALVAAAGPGANLFMALLWALAIKLGAYLVPSAPTAGYALIAMAQFGVLINLVLMVLNLLPLPPLDGGRVLAGVLPDRLSAGLGRIEPYGLIILVALLVTGVLGDILYPLITTSQSLVYAITGLSG